MLQVQKTALRKEIRNTLKDIADEINSKSVSIRKYLLMVETFRNAWQTERFMSFVSMPSEVDVIPLFAGHSIIIPYCEEAEIVPVRIMSLDELEPSGTMNILEPKLLLRSSRQVSLEQIDVVLVPGLAFDRLGNRLGRGKGYYDRFLRRLPAEVLKIGLTFKETLRDQIPHGEFDEPVDIVITESGIIQ